MKKILVSLAAAGLVLAGAAAVIAQEQEPAKTEGHSEANPTHFPIKEPKEMNWSFSGPFGTYDKAQLQRGLKVYKEVCSACHSMNLVAFRTLSDLGYSEAQVKAFAAEYTIHDGPNDDGDMFDRPGKPSDYFPPPFANEQAAAASNGGAAPPDMSLLAKARRIEFYGLGNSGIIAADAQHKFFRFDIPAVSYSDPHVQAMAASLLGPRDVLVAISTSGRSNELLDAVEIARALGRGRSRPA